MSFVNAVAKKYREFLENIYLSLSLSLVTSLVSGCKLFKRHSNSCEANRTKLRRMIHDDSPMVYSNETTFHTGLYYDMATNFIIICSVDIYLAVKNVVLLHTLSLLCNVWHSHFCADTWNICVYFWKKFNTERRMTEQITCLQY